MARRKIPIVISELQDAIHQLEAVKLFTSPRTLYEALAETPWAKALGASAAVIYLRIKEANVDPDNPVITMKVKGFVKTRRTKVMTGVTLDGLDLLMEMFRNRGIEVTGVEQLITSSLNSYDENRAIMLAWASLRDRLGIPKPAKRAASSANEAGPVIALPTVVEPIAEFVDPGITTTEEMPDGGLVLSQTEVEIELSGEPEVTSEITPVESEESQAQSFSNRVGDSQHEWMPVVNPMPIRMTTVRPVPSRPIPVRSSVPPRPMPIV